MKQKRFRKGHRWSYGVYIYAPQMTALELTRILKEAGFQICNPRGVSKAPIEYGGQNFTLSFYVWG